MKFFSSFSHYKLTKLLFINNAESKSACKFRFRKLQQGSRKLANRVEIKRFDFCSHVSEAAAAAAAASFWEPGELSLLMQSRCFAWTKLTGCTGRRQASGCVSIQGLLPSKCTFESLGKVTDCSNSLKVWRHSYVHFKCVLLLANLKCDWLASTLFKQKFIDKTLPPTCKTTIKCILQRTQPSKDAPPASLRLWQRLTVYSAGVH